MSVNENVVRGPHYKGDQQLVEKVQRRATKMIPNLRNLSYDLRLRHLNLPSLHHRRRRGDIVMAYNIMTGKERIDTHNIFNLRMNSTTRGHRYKILKQHAKSFVSQSTFCNRIVNDWNDLPHHIIEANNINTFKNALDKHWFDKNALDKHWFDKTFDTPFT